MRALLLILLLFVSSCQTQSWLGNHTQAKASHSLSSIQGQAWLEGIDKSKLESLKVYWEPQRPSFCGVCSVVIVGNELNKNRALDQDNFFSSEVKKIITAPLVSKMGLTLREMSNSASLLLPAKKVKRFYSHLTGLDFFKARLKQNNSDLGNQMVVNFSRQSLAGKGMRSGHFSIVAGYNVKARQVLILEVEGSRESFWVSDKDLFSAMLAVDPVSQIPRGWVEVSK